MIIRFLFPECLVIFISLVTEPLLFCFSSSALAALLESFSITSVHFKMSQQKAISFGSFYLLNMWYRLHGYLVNHRDISHISIPKAAGRVLCKHCQVGQDCSLSTSAREVEKITSRENCRRTNHCFPFFPHRLLLLIGGTELLPVSGTPIPSFLLLGSADTDQSVWHFPYKTCLWKIFFLFGYALWLKIVKAGIKQGYIWLSVSGMPFIQLQQKLSIQLPCFCLEENFHLH